MKIYQVDTFTEQRFKGNPAAVCILPDDFTLYENEENELWMQNLAIEMNLSETAFVKKHVKTGRVVSDNAPNSEPIYQLRWFTPKTEVDLCGHATLATAHILWEEGLLAKDKSAVFDSRSGKLEVSLNDSGMTMNFPAHSIESCKEPVGLEMALGCSIVSVHKADQDLLVEVADEKIVAELKPSIQQLAVIPVRCIIVTAQGQTVDFVSRVFGPAVGIDEDPVTGSTHCSLTPFWAERLSKTKLQALQLSKRGGVLDVEQLGDRVAISGQAVTVFKGELYD